MDKYLYEKPDKVAKYENREGDYWMKGLYAENIMLLLHILHSSYHVPSRLKQSVTCIS